MDANSGYKILLVDDMPENIVVLRNAFFKQDHIVFVANERDTALKQVHTNKPDLILLDVKLPNYSGFDILVDLKSNTETDDIPVIFLTGSTDSQSLLRGLALGAVDYIIKPFQVNEVVLRVNTHLETKRRTAILQLQHEQVKNMLKNRTSLYSRLLHELMVPIRISSNDIKMIEKTLSAGKCDQLHSLIQNLNSKNNTALNLIDKLLFWLRIENNELHPKPKSFDVDLVIKHTFNLFLEQALQKKIYYSFESFGPVMVYADIELVRIVLKEIISNGIKFTRENGDIIISVINTDENYITINVYDTGNGIDLTKVDQLFDVSRMIDKLVTQPKSEIGLGLYIANYCTQLMGGKLIIESIPGVGSDFKISIPRSHTG